LQRHASSHNGVRPFACTWPGCGYRAKQREHLKTHELIHSSLKSFKCHVCGFATKRKEHLRRHLQRHAAAATAAAATTVT
jgi:krueppel-like factor 15